ARECRGEPRREQLGIAERIADALCRDRILRVAGISDERPSRTEWLAEEVRADRAEDLRLATRVLEARLELRRQLEQAHIARVEIALALLELGARPAADDERQPVVRLACGKATVGQDVRLEAPVHRQ